MMICKVQSKMVEREREVFMMRPQVSGHVTYTFPEHASPGTNVTAYYNTDTYFVINTSTSYYFSLNTANSIVVYAQL